jgi:hypothetical protein
LDAHSFITGGQSQVQKWATNEDGIPEAEAVAAHLEWDAMDAPGEDRELPVREEQVAAWLVAQKGRLV